MVQAYSVGAYRMAYTIGVGTFGRVKLATHEKTGQKVAIKIINRARMQSMEMHEKVLREISILQRLGAHPHIVRLYELMDTPTDIFMVMEYVPGGELFDYIVQRSRLPEVEARVFFQQIISGVEYCHHHMICHRDLKPENVFLESNKSVKVGDFGLSNLMRDGDFLNTSCGSPNYAAPEVVSGKAYAGPEVDIWSCGVILYALLCGSLPFDDEHVPNLFRKIKRGNFNLPGHLSETARRLLIRMLLVDPGARISLKEIRRHPWVRENSTIPMPVWRQDPLQVDVGTLASLKELGYTIEKEDVIRHQSTTNGFFVPKEIIAYNLLLDKKRAETGASPGGSSLQAGSASSNKKPFAFCRGVKQRHLTAALFQVEYSPLGFVSFTTSRNLFGFDSQYGSQSNMTSSTRRSSNEGDGHAYTLSALSRQQSRSSVVSSVQVPDSPKWKPGIESSLDSATIMTAIFHTLRSIGYEWHIVSQHRVWCRPRLANQPAPMKLDSPHKTDTAIANISNDSRITLCIQVFRAPGGKGAVNIQVFDGSLAAGMRCALSTLFAIYRTLAQTQQQTAGLTNSRVTRKFMSTPNAPKTDIEEHLEQQLEEANRFIGTTGNEELTLTNQNLEQDLGQLSNAVNDYRLQKEAELLAREIKICEAETELAKLQLSYTECSTTIIKNEELKIAVEELTKCHVDIRSQLAICEKELSFKTDQLNTTETTTIELKRHLDETTSFCNVLKESLTYSEDLCKSFEELVKRTEKDMNLLKADNAELWKVLQEALQTLKEERVVMSQKLLSATRAKEEVEQRLHDMTPQLLPSWSRERADRQLNNSIPESLLLLASNCLRDERSAREDLERFLHQHIFATGTQTLPIDGTAEFSQKLIIMVSIRSLIEMSMNLIHHIITDKLSQSVEIASQNTLALKKDRGEIIWCYQTLKDLSDLMLWLSEYLNWTIEADVDCLVNIETKMTLPDLGKEASLNELISDVTNQLRLITESAVASKLSIASSTRSIGTLSHVISVYLEEQNYTSRWCRNPDIDGRMLPTIAVITQLLRILSGFLLFVAEDNIPENAQSIFLQQMQTMTKNTLNDFKDRWMDAMRLYLTTSKDSITIMTSFFQQPAKDHSTYSQEIINLCTSMEAMGKLTDPKETWSLPNMSSSRRQEAKIGRISEESIIELFDSFEQLRTFLKDGCLVQKELCHTRLTTTKTYSELSQREEQNRDSKEPGTSQDDVPGNSERSLIAMQREFTVLKSKLELYQLKDKEFSKAGLVNEALVQELQKKNELISNLQVSDTSFRSILEEKETRLEAAETALEESEHMRRLQTRLPPDLSAFELAKSRAVINNLQRLLSDEKDAYVTASWTKIENQLEKRKSQSASKENGLRLENLVEIALRNPGLTALLQNAGKKIHVQDILLAQAANRDHKLAVTQELCRIEAKRGAFTSKSSNIHLASSHLALIARVPVNDLHPAGKVVMDLRETQRWIEGVIF